MADALDQEALRIFKQMNDSLLQLARGSTIGHGQGDKSTRTGHSAIDEAEADNFERQIRRGTRNLSGVNRAFRDLRDATKSLTSFTKEQLQSADGKDAIKRFAQSLDNASSYIKEAAIEYNKMVGKTIPEQLASFRNLVRSSDNLTSQLTKSQRNASLLGASLIKTHSEIDENSLEYATYIKELGKAVNHLDKKFLSNAGLIDESTGEFNDSLRDTDFAEFRVKLGEAQIAITEGINNLGFGKLDDLVADRAKLEEALQLGATDVTGGGEALRDALIATAAQLEKEGFDLGLKLLDVNGQLDASKIASLGDLDFAKLATDIKGVSDSVAAAVTALDREAKARNTAIGQFKKSWMTLDGIIDNFSKKLGQATTTAAAMASFAKAIHSVKDIYKQIYDFNIAQVPASFLEVEKASLKMGMSLEETVKFLQENKRALAIYGSSGFDSLTMGLKDTFQKFGYTMRQAGELVGPAIESGIASGINIRNGEALNKFIDETMNSFKNISGIVNISASEYMKLNADLLNTHDIQGALLGMDKERAQAYAKQLIALRNNYIQMGLSTEQAQALVKAQQEQQRARVTDKIRAGAMAMVAAQQAGMSPEESARIMALTNKKRTADEERELAELLGRLSVAQERQLQNAQDTSGTSGYLAQQALQQALDTSGLKQMMDLARQAETAKRAEAQVNQPQAREAGERAIGDEGVASFGNTLNSLESLIKNPLSTAIWGTVTGFGTLIAQSLMLTKTFMGMNSAMGGKGLFDTLKDGILGRGKDGAPGKIAGALGGGIDKLGKLVGVGGTAGLNTLSAGAGVGTLAAQGALVAAAGGAGYAAGKYIVNPILDKGAQLITGQKDATVGTVVYDAIDKLSSLWGGDDKSKMAGIIAPQDKKKQQQQIPVVQKLEAAAVGDQALAPKTSPVTQANPQVPTRPAMVEPATIVPPAVGQTQQSKPEQGKEVNNEARRNKDDVTKPLTVEDAAAREKLTSIAESLVEAVAYLKKISEADESSSVRAAAVATGLIPSRQIPTAVQYMTGRANM